MEKYCNQCDQTKSLDEFSKLSKAKDGKQPQCKACNKVNNAKFRKTRPKYQEDYYYTPQGYKNKIKAVNKYWNQDGAGIYVIKNTKSGKLYVGQSLQLKRRQLEWKQWLAARDTYHINYKMIADVDKYGADSFKFGILEVLENPQKKTLMKREYFYIQMFNKVVEMYNIDVVDRPKKPRD